MRLIYAILTLTYGVCLLVAAFLWRVIPIAFLQFDHATGMAFVVSAVLAIPFVVTYTKLGLNSAEGEEPSPETKARHAELKRECPIWQIAWYGGIGFALLAWVGSATVQIPVRPFFAFSGMISCLTGVWFLLAYPVASRLFLRNSRPTQNAR